jgi:hypothetical protein
MALCSPRSLPKRSAWLRVTTCKVELLEGARTLRTLHVAALVDEYMGTSVYMDIAALQRLMRRSPTVSGAVLLRQGVTRMRCTAHQGSARDRRNRLQKARGDRPSASLRRISTS